MESERVLDSVLVTVLVTVLVWIRVTVRVLVRVRDPVAAANADLLAVAEAEDGGEEGAGVPPGTALADRDRVDDAEGVLECVGDRDADLEPVRDRDADLVWVPVRDGVFVCVGVPEGDGEGARPVAHNLSPATDSAPVMTRRVRQAPTTGSHPCSRTWLATLLLLWVSPTHPTAGASTPQSCPR